MFATLLALAAHHGRLEEGGDVLVQTYIDPSVAGQILRASSVDRDELTPREMEVLRRLALGHSNKEIASELHIAEETVKTHIARILAKLQVENRAQAIVGALKRGLVRLEELQ